MRDLTVSGVIRQVEAMGANTYSIGLCNFKTSKMINRHFLTINDIVNMVKWLKYQNLNNYNVFIKPNFEIDRPLILLDDLDGDKIMHLKSRGLNPACVVETSPANFQAWLSIGDDPMPSQHRTFLSKILVKKFGADPGCSDANHYGRLAGFTNRKDKYFKNNYYPFAICHEWTGQSVDNVQQIREWVAKQVIEEQKAYLDALSANITNSVKIKRKNVFATYFIQWSDRIQEINKTYDMSRGEFGVTCRMIKEGYGRDEIFADFKLNALFLESRKYNHMDDYINRTINAAEKRCLSELCQSDSSRKTDGQFLEL